MLHQDMLGYPVSKLIWRIESYYLIDISKVISKYASLAFVS